MTTNSVDTLVEKYVKIRDKKAEIAAEQKKVMERINGALKKLEAAMMQEMQTAGAESIRTAAGTCYVSTKTTAKVQDREAFLDFVRENGAWDFIESRANPKAVEEYVGEHEELPPGVTTTRYSSVNVRRA
jgi:hypothetical protein